MNILKKNITRLNVTIALIIIQVVLFVALLNRIIAYLPIISIFNYLLSILIVIFFVKKEEAPAYKIIWIIIIMALPILGGPLYLLFGNSHLTKKVTNRINEEHSLIADQLYNCDGLSDYSAISDGRAAACMQYIQQVSSYPAYQNTEIKYYPFGESMFEDMLTELSNSKKFIFLEYFIIYESEMWNKIVEILMKKAAEGVDVRIIFDDLGSFDLFTKSYVSELKSKNIRIVRFNPIIPFFSLFMNNRDHRKIMVIDGNIGFTGGVNITDESINLESNLGVWKDTGIRLKGSAVWSLSLTFIETWNSFCTYEDRIDNYSLYKEVEKLRVENDGIVIPYGDTPLNDERLGENIYIDILNQAQNYVYIFTPYLIISDKMIYALQMAAKRGVDVRVMTPGIPDKKIVYRATRSHYSYLLKAGVRIYEYSPGFLHAKSFVSDDEIAVIGTINLDYRSLYLHFECATLLYRTSSIKMIKKDAINTMTEGREVLLNNKKTRFASELFDAILHLFAPLM